MATRTISHVIAGLVMATVGVAGFTTAWSPTSAAAQEQGADSHTTMHSMMETVHGPDAVAQMHQMDGAEDMMDQCADMMNGRGMSGMMNGRGMSDMMNR